MGVHECANKNAIFMKHLVY